MNSALVLIDIQNDYFSGGKSELYHSEQAAQNAKLVLDVFRSKAMPVYHVQHVNTRENATFFIPNSVGAAINKYVAPLTGEDIIIKHVPNSFFETELQRLLIKNNIQHLVVCGMMSHMCVDTTVRAAKDLGYSITVIQDACTTKDLLWNHSTINAQVVHDTFMAALSGMFAEVQNANEFIMGLKNAEKL